jgi:hypothetical protein
MIFTSLISNGSIGGILNFGSPEELDTAYCEHQLKFLLNSSSTGIQRLSRAPFSSCLLTRFPYARILTVMRDTGQIGLQLILWAPIWDIVSSNLSRDKDNPDVGFLSIALVP